MASYIDIFEFGMGEITSSHSGIGLIFREGLDPELSLCIGFQMIGP